MAGLNENEDERGEEGVTEGASPSTQDHRVYIKQGISLSACPSHSLARPLAEALT